MRNNRLYPLLLLSLVACAPDPPPVPSFTDVAALSGLDFTHTSGANGDYFLFETMGAGAAFLDYDLDGRLDIYLVDGFDLSHLENRFAPVNLKLRDGSINWVEENYTPPLRYDSDIDPSARLVAPSTDTSARRNKLFRNAGGTFNSAPGADDDGYGMGVAVGDCDNDGDPDLYVTNYGPNTLYRNDRGAFARASDATTADPRWSASAAFVDIDLDGDLDLYAVNYLDFHPANNRLCGGVAPGSKRQRGLLAIPDSLRTYCAPRRYNGAPDALYRNDGGARFVDIAAQAGIANLFGKGLGVVAGDYDLDGDPDLYIANDGVRNFFYRNDGARFVDIAPTNGSAYNGAGAAEAGMGVDAGDYDMDGDLDLFATNFSRESNTLYRNDRDAGFKDVSQAAGLEEASYNPLGFGAFFFDRDNDADLDFYVANGHVMDRIQALEEDLQYAQPDQLFLNDGHGHFTAEAFTRPLVSRGAARGDYDDDGDLDILVNHVNAPAALYRNDLPPGAHWLGLVLKGRTLGARVRLDCGDHSQFRTLSTSGTYLSAHDPRLHFGLGACSHVDRIEITWPGGENTMLENVAVDRYISVP
jgi:hypothetical protein